MAQPVLGPHIHAPATALPERIVQFGTGRFLRAFADCFVDEANEAGRYDGRIVAVQSTSRARADLLQRQGGLYTVWVRGGTPAAPRETHRVISSVSRGLSAAEQWPDVLELARSPHLEAVFSNTTEVGLALSENDRLAGRPPQSFPAKLAAFLLARARHFDCHPDRGLVVLPCELVADNGDLLQKLILQLAGMWQVEPAFVEWLASANVFCNTLVDRIVPGLPSAPEVAAFEDRVGYRDELLTMAEEYRLWAIEAEAAPGFATGEETIVVAPDITPYRLRKVRLLNGGHTLSVPLGFLAGNRTVLENMEHPLTGPYIEALLSHEIGPVLAVDPATVAPYADEVLARWRNPFLRHALIDITLQGTTKMRHRVVPSLREYYARFERVPHLIAAGFASYLLFSRGEGTGTAYSGSLQGERYPINDDRASVLAGYWKREGAAGVTHAVCSDTGLWGADLGKLPGFADAVSKYLDLMLNRGIQTALEQALAETRKP